MKVIIFGSSGMIGKGVLLESLDYPEVKQVLVINRSSIGITHPKLREVLHKDFEDMEPLRLAMTGYDACFFCLGISAAGLSESAYTKITYNFSMTAAKLLHEINPAMTFSYVSGQGTDSSERGRAMWARVKGKTENDLLKLGFKKAVMFRPGIILPKRGIKSRTAMYRAAYTYLGWLLNIIARIWPDSVTDTTRIGLAMINAHRFDPPKQILDPKDINDLAAL